MPTAVFDLFSAPCASPAASAGGGRSGAVFPPPVRRGFAPGARFSSPRARRQAPAATSCQCPRRASAAPPRACGASDHRRPASARSLPTGSGIRMSMRCVFIFACVLFFRRHRAVSRRHAAAAFFCSPSLPFHAARYPVTAQTAALSRKDAPGNKYRKTTS